MPTQAERTAAARRRLLDAATELIAEQGIAATSVAQIGARAGMSRGAVNFHFVSKDALLTAVAEEVTSDWEGQAFGAVPPLEMPMEAALDAFLAHSLRDLTEEAHRARTMMILAHESMGATPLLRSHFVMLHRRVRRSVAELVRQRQQSGQVPEKVDPDAFALMVIAMFRGIVFQYLLDPEDVDLTRAHAAARDAIIGYLRS